MPNQILRMVANGNESQIALFHDSPYAALQTAVNAIGGAKRVAAELWPTKASDTAYNQLKHSLQDDRPEKLSLEELFHICRKASALGAHAFAEYFAQECGYEIRPLDPDEARKRAKRVRQAQLLAELQRLMDDDE
jgi:hypothetical protein